MSHLVQLVVGVVLDKHVPALVQVGPPGSCGTFLPYLSYSNDASESMSKRDRLG